MVRGFSKPVDARLRPRLYQNLWGGGLDTDNFSGLPGASATVSIWHICRSFFWDAAPPPPQLVYTCWVPAVSQARLC